MHYKKSREAENLVNFIIALYCKGTALGKSMPVRVSIFVIASAIVVLAWLKQEGSRFSLFSDLPLWYSNNGL